ncbi:MAG: hypothetical protein LBF04_03795 [Prevotellaceae bacterium]|jgi:hypothetical protein|nr:hypothetical protein [Prevotellaceae bacterium]
MAGTKQPDAVRVILKCNGEEHICKYMPIGWRDQSASWSFGFDRFGYGIKYTPDSMRLAKGDADFVRRCLDLYGISAAIDVIIQHRQNNWTYKDTWTGQTRLEDGYINEVDFFEIQICEGGLKRAFDKNGKTNFDIPFDEDAVNIEVTEGMNLYEQVKYKFSRPERGYVYPFIGQPAPMILNLDDTSLIVTNQLKFNSQSVESDGTSTPFLNTLMYSGDDISLEFNTYLNLDMGSRNFSTTEIITVFVREIRSNGIVQNYPLNQFYITEIPVISESPTVLRRGVIQLNSKNFKFKLSKDYTSEFIIYFDKSLYEGRNNTLLLYGVNFNVEFYGTVKSGVFNFQAYRAEKFGQKLLDKVHAGAIFDVPFLQEMEQNENMQLFITSADAIRGIKVTDDNPQGALIKTNFNEFKDNLNKLFSTGEQCSVKDNFYRILKKHEIFGNSELINLGNVKKMQIIQPDEDWLLNNIKVGYEKQEYDYPLGRQEFAATLEFINDLNVDSKTLDLVSDYRADYTGVHLLHFDYVNADKKDSKSDNDVFWILAFWKDEKWQAIKGDRITAINGMEGGGYFNILLSPKTMLINRAAFFASILDKHEKTLRYTSSTETMSALEYTDTQLGQVTEKADLDVSNAVPFFKPIIFMFDCIVPVSLSEIMGETPCGYFTFKYNNLTLKGFPIDVQGSYVDSVQTVKCIAHPDTPDNIQEILHKRLPNKVYK